MHKLERASVADWLRAQEPAAVVGQAWEPNTCPLARYLREHGYGGDFAVVCGPTWVAARIQRLVPLRRRGGGQRLVQQRLPRWTAAFVRGVDADKEMKDSITAAEALAVLARLP